MRIFKAILLLILTATPIHAIELTPKWSEKDNFLYNIEISDERPPNGEKRWITEHNFKASLTVLKKTSESYAIEWQFFPVENPVSKCPLPTILSCNDWTTEARKNLRVIFHTNIWGEYLSLGNPEEVREQLGKAFDSYASVAKHMKTLDKETLARLRESAENDDLILTDLLGHSSIFGNTTENGQLAPNSRLLAWG